MTPTQLRQLADDIEKGKADAKYHIEVDAEDRKQDMYGDWNGSRYLGQRWQRSKIIIEVICWTDVAIKHPVSGEWIFLDSTG